MPLVTMPNGEVVDVPENITPEGLARIRQEYRQTRAQRVSQGQPRRAPPTEEQQEVQRRADFEEQRLAGNDAATRGSRRGLTFSLNDELAGVVEGGTFGVVDAIRQGDLSRIGRRYRVARDTERELDRRAHERSPVSAAVGEVTGALVNPLGTGARGVQALGRGAQALGATRTGNVLARTGARMERAGPIAQGIMAGAGQGALNAAGSAENLSDVPGALLEGGLVGGAAGGVLGGGLHLGARGAQIIRDALPRNAQRTAYARIADLLESGRMTPQQAQAEIRMTDMAGGDAMVQDLLPSLRAQAAHISRRPNVPSSNQLIERGEGRIQARRDLFTQKARETANTPAGGDDAFARATQLQGERRGVGGRDYAEGGAMDAPLNWTRELDDFFRASPDADRLIRQAYTTAERFGQPLGRVEEGQAIPSMRAFDYLKREFDSQIGMAQRAGDTTLAAGLSNQLTRLKQILGDANPEYATVLAAQRDLFQQQNALEIGRNVLGRLGNNPRKVLEDLKALPRNAWEDARVGIIDALVNLDNRADPVAFFRNVSRNDAQRRVLEFAFGGRKEFRRFQRFVDREVRSTRADVLTAPGRQSETSRIGLAGDEEHGGISNVLSNAMRGYAFGGAVGAGSGVVRTLQNIAGGTSRFAQEEIAKILLSKGDDLVPQIESVRRYQNARRRSNRRRAVMGGKAGQQLITSAVGED